MKTLFITIKKSVIASFAGDATEQQLLITFFTIWIPFISVIYLIASNG